MIICYKIRKKDYIQKRVIFIITVCMERMVLLKYLKI